MGNYVDAGDARADHPCRKAGDRCGSTGSRSAPGAAGEWQVARVSSGGEPAPQLSQSVRCTCHCVVSGMKYRLQRSWQVEAPARITRDSNPCGQADLHVERVEVVWYDGAQALQRGFMVAMGSRFRPAQLSPGGEHVKALEVDELEQRSLLGGQAAHGLLEPLVDVVVDRLLLGPRSGVIDEIEGLIDRDQRWAPLQLVQQVLGSPPGAVDQPADRALGDVALRDPTRVLLLGLTEDVLGVFLAKARGDALAPQQLAKAELSGAQGLAI